MYHKDASHRVVVVPPVIAQIVGWAKADLIHKSETTMGVATNCHLT
jgi:hypothetical protein